MWQALAGSDEDELGAVLLSGCRASFQRMIAEKQDLAAEETKHQVISRCRRKRRCGKCVNMPSVMRRKFAAVQCLLVVTQMLTHWLNIFEGEKV